LEVQLPLHISEYPERGLAKSPTSKDLIDNSGLGSQNPGRSVTYTSSSDPNELAPTSAWDTVAGHTQWPCPCSVSYICHLAFSPISFSPKTTRVAEKKRPF
jgi:hypothetical protein